jgi:hypothetical protein
MNGFHSVSLLPPDRSIPAAQILRTPPAVDLDPELFRCPPTSHDIPIDIAKGHGMSYRRTSSESQSDLRHLRMLIDCSGVDILPELTLERILDSFTQRKNVTVNLNAPRQH